VDDLPGLEVEQQIIEVSENEKCLKGELLSTVNLLVRVACFVTKVDGNFSKSK